MPITKKTYAYLSEGTAQRTGKTTETEKTTEIVKIIENRRPQRKALDDLRDPQLHDSISTEMAQTETRHRNIREDDNNHEYQGKTRIRRGNKNKKNRKYLNIWYNNINGIISKKNSLQVLLTTDQPHIVILTETKTNQLPPITGYRWIAQSKPNKAGGVAIAAREDIAHNVSETEAEKEEGMELIWVTMKTNNMKVYIAAYYGKQEAEKREIVENEYSTLTTNIIRHQNKGPVIIIGDFNAKLKVDNQGTTIQEESNNGKLLQQMMDNTGLKPVSTKPNIGLWTRVNRNKTEEKSIIDYIITERTIARNIEYMEIDDKGIRRPSGLHETDHNTITMKIKIPSKKEKREITRWNIKETTNWEKYNEILQNKTTPENYEQLQDNIKKTLEEAIGKKKIIMNNKPKLSTDAKMQKAEMKRTKRKFEEECKSNGNNKHNIYQSLVKQTIKLRQIIQRDEEERITKIAKKLAKEGGVKSKYFWNIRKSLMKKNHEEYDLVTEDDRIIEDPIRAKEEIATYFEQLYQARPPKEGYTKWTEQIENKHTEIEDEMKTKEQIEQITVEELKTAIKKLKDGKATGPDEIPNEAIKNLTDTNLNNMKTIMNKITEDITIPESWLTSNIIRFYKGKGKRGKCSSERGITLSSNVGKLYERIINERIIKNITITDEQAGGRKGRSTTEHIAAITTIIDRNKKKRKPTYITFLDVTKAYDKAWNKAIMHVMYKQGLQEKIWLIVNQLNQNLTANIQTKYGPTREIKIKDSIRQGGVLSVVQYALLIDEISKETRQNLQDQNQEINTLLWMDDIALISNNIEDMEKLLQQTNEIASRYRIEFSPEKSNIIQIGNDPQNPKKAHKFKVGTLPIDYTKKYRYLGYVFNEKANLSEHISTVKSKSEIAYQTIISLLGNREFGNIRMTAVWKLLETCVIPVITYASETWNPSKKDRKTLNGILDNTIKRILMVPRSTPREAIYIETNMMDIDSIIEKKKLNMYYRIKNNKNKINNFLTNEGDKTAWLQNTEKLMQKYNINKQELIAMKETRAKKYIRKAVHREFRTNLFTNTEQKNKIKYLTGGYVGNEKANYTNDLNRETTSLIFKARTRMLDIKTNYRNKYKNDLTCRLCKQEEETQEHVFSECEETERMNIRIDKDLLFARSTTVIKKQAEKIKILMQTLEK